MALLYVLEACGRLLLVCRGLPRVNMATTSAARAAWLRLELFALAPGASAVAAAVITVASLWKLHGVMY